MGHHALGIFCVAPKQEGTLAEQLTHAEAMNLQMRAGLAWVHGFSPRFASLERALDLLSQSQQGLFPKTRNRIRSYAGQASLASGKEQSGWKITRGDVEFPHLLMSKIPGEGKGTEGQKPSNEVPSIEEERNEPNLLVESAHQVEGNGFDQLENLAEKDWKAFNVLSEEVLSGKPERVERARQSLARVIMKDPQKYLNFILEIAKGDPRNKPIVLKIFSEVASEDPEIILELDPLGQEKIKDPSPNLEI